MLRPPSSSVDIEKPVVAEYGILGRASTVKTLDSDWWLNGFTHSVADANVNAELLRILGPESAGLNVSEDGPSTIAYSPFMVQTKVKGSTFGANLDSFKETAENALDVIIQKAVEQEFWGGTLSKLEQATYPDEPTNRYLASVNAVDVSPTLGTGVKVRYAQALLEGALGRMTIGYKGTIHAPREVASVMRVQDSDGVLTTRLGNSVIAGSGYTGTGPDGTYPGDGKYWIYATGPVTVLLGDEVIIPDTLTQAINTRNNDVEYIAEKPAAVVWSTKDVFAVLVDLTLDYA